MARTIAATIQQLTARENLQPGYEFESLPEDVIEVADVTQGMVSALPRTRIPSGAFLNARNARVESNGIRRRDGSVQFQNPFDSNPILLLASFISSEGNVRLVRITADGIQYSLGGDPFIAYDEGPNVDFNGLEIRPTVTPFLNDLYVGGFTDLLRLNHGFDEVQVVEEGPKGARFVETFADRIIAANISGQSYLIQWSANGDPLDWTSISAGEEPLVQAPSDVGDAITGLFAMETGLVVLRRTSIWLVTRQPFAAQPFRFDAVHVGFGCDLPHSAVQVPGGIIYADLRTRGVYFYQLGATPVLLSRSIQNELFEGLTNPEWVQGSFNWKTLTYRLGIPTGETEELTKIWNFNLLREPPTWTYDDGPVSRSLGIFLVEDGTFIDGLIGDIDDLMGSIDNLSEEGFIFFPFYGLQSGRVLREDPTADGDLNSSFQLVLESPNFGSISRRRTIKDFMLTVEFNRPGSVDLAYSKNRMLWANEKTVVLSGDRVAKRKNLFTGDDLYWRLTATSSDVLVKTWWLRFGEKGLQR